MHTLPEIVHEMSSRMSYGTTLGSFWFDFIWLVIPAFDKPCDKTRPQMLRIGSSLEPFYGSGVTFFLFLAVRLIPSLSILPIHPSLSMAFFSHVWVLMQTFLRESLRHCLKRTRSLQDGRLSFLSSPYMVSLSVRLFLRRTMEAVFHDNRLNSGEICLSKQHSFWSVKLSWGFPNSADTH